MPEIFDEVATENSLTLVVSKIKLLVAGIGFADHDLAPLELGGGIANGSG